MGIFELVVTIIAGYLGAGILGINLNWSEAGTIVAIAVMGAFIIRKLNELKDD